MTITISDEDAASELSFEFNEHGEDRPPTPRPKTIRKTLRNFCITQSPSTTCGLPSMQTNSMEWPSDEEQDDDEEENENGGTLAYAAANFLPTSKLDSVCGLQFWQPSTATPNSWGLMIADRDDEDEGRLAPSTRDNGLTSSGSTHEYREPMVTLRDAPFYTSTT